MFQTVIWKLNVVVAVIARIKKKKEEKKKVVAPRVHLDGFAVNPASLNLVNTLLSWPK